MANPSNYFHIVIILLQNGLICQEPVWGSVHKLLYVIIRRDELGRGKDMLLVKDRAIIELD